MRFLCHQLISLDGSNEKLANSDAKACKTSKGTSVLSGFVSSSYNTPQLYGALSLNFTECSLCINLILSGEEYRHGRKEVCASAHIRRQLNRHVSY